jgi:DNA-binding NarL/FixJ family response regulator
MSIVLVTERPVLEAGFAELIRTAGFNSEYSLVSISQLAVALAGTAFSELVVVDCDPCMDWHFLSFERRQAPLARFVLWANQITPHLAQIASEAGFDGIVSTRLATEDAARELLAICRGERPFMGEASNPRNRASVSCRESEVLDMVLRGFKNREIAKALHTSEGTVKVLMNRLFRKMGVSSRYELVLAAHFERGQRETPVQPTADPYAGAPFDEWWMLSTGAELV